MTTVSENNASGDNISAEILTSLWKLGFKLVPLSHDHIPFTKWTPIYDDINYWQEDDFNNLQLQKKFVNVASTFGRTHLKDSQNRTLFIQALDVDSEHVFDLLNTTLEELYIIEKLRPVLDEMIWFSRISKHQIMNFTLLDLFKDITFVTKTKKLCGYHIWWLSHEQNKSILTPDCKRGYEFEIKTDKKSGLCTLPPSTYRNDKNFRYTSVGQNQQLLTSDSLYGLFLELFQQCIIQNDCKRNTINNGDPALNKSNIGKFYELSPDAITASAILLSPFYRAKSRNNFVLYFSGYAYHSKISENSTSKIISEICTIQKDEAKDERHSTVHYTYKKALDHKPVTGSPAFIEFLSQVGESSIAHAQKTIDNLKNLWLDDFDTNVHNYGKSKDDENNNKHRLTEIVLSVSQTKMYHEGRVKVRGKIMKCSGSFKMISATNYICSNQECNFKTKIRYTKPLLLANDKDVNVKCSECGKSASSSTLEYINAIDLELQDVDNVNDIDRLLVYLFEENIKSMKIGETVVIEGNISVINKNDNKRKKLIPALYGNSISYEHNEKIELTSKDMEEINRLRKEKEKAIDTESGIVELGGVDWVEYLVSLFAPQIARNYYPKLALLLAAVNSGSDEVFRKRDRIHVLLVGEPGLAKTKLLEDVIELVPNSKYMSMSNTSGISLTAMIEKDESGGGYSVRAGSIVLAQSAIFAANEIGDLNFKNQLYLGDIMEEGVTHISKYTIDAQLVAPVTMISACNPIGTYWKYLDHIDPSEIPMPPKEIDRYDLQFFMRMPRDESDLRLFASELRNCDKNHPGSNDYTLLRKVILYAKQFKPVLSEDAKSEIENFWVTVATQRGSVRIKNVLERLTKAFAKLRFKNMAETEEANDAISLYKYVMSQYDFLDNPYTIPRNPQHVAADECAKILKENPFVDKRVDDLIIIACSKNSQVASYFSGEKKIKTSYKARAVRDILIQNPNIKQVGNNPITLQWFEKHKQDRHHEIQTPHSKTPNSSNSADSMIISKEQKQIMNNYGVLNDAHIDKREENRKTNQSNEGNEGNECDDNQCNKNRSIEPNASDIERSTSNKMTITTLPSSPSSPSKINNNQITNNNDNNTKRQIKLNLNYPKAAEIQTNDDLMEKGNHNQVDSSEGDDKLDF